MAQKVPSERLSALSKTMWTTPVWEEMECGNLYMKSLDHRIFHSNSDEKILFCSTFSLSSFIFPRLCICADIYITNDIKVFETLFTMLIKKYRN